MTEVLIYATPVALAALGETIGQKAGVINIGLEGIMLSGSFVALVVTQSSGQPWLGLIAGAAVGIVLALFQALFTIQLALDQVVVGTALNLALLGVTSTLYRQSFGSSGALISINTIPRIGPVDAVVLLSIFLVPLLHWWLFRTRKGLALRSVGEYPPAVVASGLSVRRLRFFAQAVAGAFGGAAGAYLCVGTTGSFAEEMTKGFGFVAIAMVTFGRWNLYFVYLVSVVIGYLDGLQFQLQASGIQAPSQLMLALPYLVALGLLVALGKGRAAPEALAIPYEVGKK